VITDLIQIRRQGEKNRDENLRFRKYLKSRVWVERQFRKAAQEVTDQIDCRACAECCRVSEVEITERDVEHLSKYLGIAKQDFVSQYTATGTNDEAILKRTKAGCVFLDGNDCTVYDARPANCERFPHLLRGSGSIPSRMWQFVDRATYCPIVYNWMEAAKKLTKFRGS
jgi:Fe-S-cluster containining protein